MNRPTVNRIAKANIRINRKAYTSLLLGILTAVYLATATSLCAWGTIRGHEEQMAERVGWMDMILLGSESATDEQLRRSGFFGEIGHVTVNACVEGTAIHAGYYDETAGRLMDRRMKEGRLPEKAGEIAAELSALIRMDLEKTAVGDTLTLTMHPIYGTSEEKTFTLVGILNEQTDRLNTSSDEKGMRFPALLVSPEETYASGSPVVHRVLTYAPLITYNQVVRNCPVRLEMPYGVSRETGRVVYYDSGWDRAQNILKRIRIWAVLGAALMLSACVGITSSMESLLGRKTEDIGMLRAIGATRRQVRRIYGAEAWMLTVTALPAGLLAGIATAWLVSRAAPDLVVFSLNAWLLVPILGLSALCVFIASRVPLYHASRQMPMGVLRDTALLRRAGGIRKHRTFKPDRLIAERRARLYPMRQIGAAGMTALTLVSTLILAELALGLNFVDEKDAPAFRLTGEASIISEDAFIQVIRTDDMSRDDLRRIAAIPGVSRVRSVTELSANLLMNRIPEYFRSVIINRLEPDGASVMMKVGVLDTSWNGSDWLFYTDEDLADARARQDEDFAAGMDLRTIGRMNTIRSMLGLEEIPVPVRLYVADLDEPALKAFVTDGAIDMERLDRGEQALVYAPTVCVKQFEGGGTEINRWLYPGEAGDGEWDVIIRNNAFSAGTPLNLLELAADEKDLDETGILSGDRYGSLKAVRAETAVGAVLSGPAAVNECSMSSFSVILSSKGAEAMGLILPGPNMTDIYLSGSPAPKEEAEIGERIGQIAMSSWTDLENMQQQNREYMAKKLRQMLLFAALILLFFAVSVFMQVSGAARQIRTETRTIGTLRAVGADLETLVGCYCLPVWISSAAALIPCVILYAVRDVPALRLFRDNHPQIVIPLLIVLAVCVAVACIEGIRRRLAAVTRQSIVDNIREL